MTPAAVSTVTIGAVIIAALIGCIASLYKARCGSVIMTGLRLIGAAVCLHLVVVYTLMLRGTEIDVLRLPIRAGMLLLLTIYITELLGDRG